MIYFVYSCHCLVPYYNFDVYVGRLYTAKCYHIIYGYTIMLLVTVHEYRSYGVSHILLMLSDLILTLWLSYNVYRATRTGIIYYTCHRY